MQPERLTSLIGSLAILAGCSEMLHARSPAGGTGDQAAATSRMRLLMPDDFSDMQLLAWRVERGEPDPNNPLIEGDMPWDAGGLGYHGSVLKDPVDALLKAYLVCTPADPAYSESEPWSSDNHAKRYLCLFESADGIHWSRPELSNVSYEASERTNILFDLKDGMTSYPSVFVKTDGSPWPYDMIVLRESYKPSVHGTPPQGNGYYRYRSKDGRVWDLVRKIQGPMTGDLAFFYKYADDDYVAYFRLAGARQANDHVPIYEDAARRSCFRAVSRDGNVWEKDASMALTADERDHRDTQYQECVPLKVNGGYFAFITMYHPLTQTLNLRIASSRDGRQWWFPDRVTCLDNPPLGDYGGGMIWQSQNLIVENGKLYVYYGATEGLHRQLSDTRAKSVKIGAMEAVIDHGGHFLPMSSALCRASWPLDRLYALVSSAGGSTISTATTKPTKLAGASLWLNFQTRPAKKSERAGFDEGYFQAELLDGEGQPLAGFKRDDCPLLRGDHHEVQVKWAGGTMAPNQARSAKFYLKRAFLYGFEFRDTGNAIAAQPTATSGKVESKP